MKTIDLGTSGISIPAAAVGTWAWGTGFNGAKMIFGHKPDKQELGGVFKAMTDTGLTFIDTAAVYGMGTSENTIGEFLRTVPDHNRFVIATKFTPLPFHLSPRTMRAWLKKSLQRLGIDTVGLYQIHNPRNIPRWTDAIAYLYKEGLIRAIGVSNHTLEQTRKAADILDKLGVRLHSVQNHYSPLYRVYEKSGLIKWCTENQVNFLSYMVLEQGVISDRFSPDNPPARGSRRGFIFKSAMLSRVRPLVDQLRKTGEKYGGMSVAETAISWAAAKGTVPLVGATRTSHVFSLLKACETDIDESDIMILDSIADSVGVELKAGWEPAIDSP